MQTLPAAYMQTHHCFCTLAVGKRYRLHAKMLAGDIQKYAPETAFVVLTDKPKDFEHLANVLAFPHWLQSVKGYHDKRFVLEKALSLFAACIFVDSDVRLLGSVPQNLPFADGIVARYGCGIVKHNSTDTARAAFTSIQSVANRLNLNLEEVYWFHEFMFLLSKQQGKEQAFFECWRAIAREFEMNGIYDGEGSVMGLAAAATGLNISFHRSDFFPCFKDSIQKEKIKNGQADPQAMIEEFNTHREIEYPSRSLFQKVINKAQSRAGFYRRLLTLRISAYLSTDTRLKTPQL